MNLVQPIRDPEKIQAMKDYLKQKSDRDYILFLLGIGTGLRISDILKLKKEDLIDTHVSIRETKTRKQKRIRITPSIRKELLEYLKGFDDWEYVIQSRQGDNKAIDRSTAYRILREAAQHVRLREIGTHTLRKTFGYHFYKQTKNVAMLQEIFNHSSPAITLRYIGINQDNMDEAMMSYRI
ncbi:site-specific integrase [Rossellomorea marisflavi]|uniref:site-specific integrase n=1 Tax=Rossellomorea marisflavi TaxID=189381 RepID=UPI0039BF0DF0